MSPQDLFHRDFLLEVVIAAAVFVVITGVMFFAVARFRRRPGSEPSHVTSHSKLELVYGAAVAALAIFLVANSITTNGERIDAKPSLQIDVTGFQWCWKFHYVTAGSGAGGSAASGPTVTGRCVDGNVPVAVVPVGQVIRFDVTSDDVIHAFWIPYLKYKTFAYPGHVNSFEARFTAPGTYPGRCAEFCGLYHAEMQFKIRSVPAAQFQQWLANPPAGGSGAPAGGSGG